MWRSFITFQEEKFWNLLLAKVSWTIIEDKYVKLDIMSFKHIFPHWTHQVNVDSYLKLHIVDTRKIYDNKHL